MHTELQKVFDEHRAPQHASSEQAQTLLRHVHAAATPILHQLVVFRGLVADAELSAPTPEQLPTLEHIHQTFTAFEREVNALVAHARSAAVCATQLKRYLGEQEASILAAESKAAKALAASTPVPVDGAQAAE